MASRCTHCTRACEEPQFARCSTCRAISRRCRQKRRAYRPLDETLASPKVKLLRTLRRFDWIAPADLNELVGAIDPTDRETCTKALSRMVPAGLVERRAHQLPSWLHGEGLGSPYEYRITQRGRAELARLLTTDMAVAYE